MTARTGILDADSIVRCLELEDNQPLKNFRFVLFVQEVVPIICSVFGESVLDKLTTTGNAASKQSGGTNLSNSFILDAAEALLAKHGLKAERINLAEHMSELSIYRQLTSKQILRFKEAMNHCNYWSITLDDTRKPQAFQKQRPFEMSYTLEKGILRLTLCGRVDSISAPKILTA